jgi:hypothetical protein
MTTSPLWFVLVSRWKGWLAAVAATLMACVLVI